MTTSVYGHRAEHSQFRAASKVRAPDDKLVWMIYLDHASTTPMLPEVWEAMRPYAVERFGNPASTHAAGRKARQAIEDAREKIAQLLEATADEVVFTSGATEANNLAIFGLVGSPPGHILASRIEHPSVIEPLKQLAGRGFDVEFLPVDSHGVVPAGGFIERLRPDTRLSVLMLANHETGAIQPVDQAASQAPAFHSDAVQAVGKLAVSFRKLGVASLSLSGHKLGGPKGIGALIVKKGTRLNPLLFGGHQQQGRRPGTEPVAACDRFGGGAGDCDSADGGNKRSADAASGGSLSIACGKGVRRSSSIRPKMARPTF